MLARDPVKTSNLFDALTQRRQSSSSPISKVLTPLTPISTNSDGKKKRKKKKKSSAPSSLEYNDSERDSHSESTNSNREESTQLPLSRRLEIAASHADIHAALVGLLGWSRLYVNTDTILAFFQCDALELLLKNILTRNKHSHVEGIYDNLILLLSNCLYIERDGKATNSSKEVATVVVAAVRAMSEKLADDIVSPTKVASYLSKIVVKYRLSLNGVKSESSLSRDILDIESQLSTAATKDSDVRGQTIHDSFQRRDIRSDALTLYETRLSKITKLVDQNMAPSAHPTCTGDASNSFLAFALQDEIDAIQVDPTQIENITQQLSTLNAEKKVAVAPLEEKKKQNEESLLKLHKTREELEAKLRAINAQIQIVLDEQNALDVKLEQVDNEYQAQTERVDYEYQRVLRIFEQKKKRDEIEHEFMALESAISKISLEHSEVQSLKDKQVVCLRQQLEGTLRYFASELPCLKFMMGRVEEAQIEYQKLLEEVKGYEALGVHTVAKELKENARKIYANLLEDKACIEALKKRDFEILGMVERIFTPSNQSMCHDVLTLIGETLKEEVQRHVTNVKAMYGPIEDMHP